MLLLIHKMGKIIYAELDEITFDKIKAARNASGMIDEKKMFKNLKEGDSVIFSCRNRKIEAYLKKIKIYNSIGEYLLENKDIKVLEINSRKPLKFLQLMSNIKPNGDIISPNKKIRIYEVDYHPYGDGDEDENNDNNSKTQDITNFIEALISNKHNCNDDDEY